jgi:asparagine synthetase B (glutamine-hydrolysing)
MAISLAGKEWTAKDCCPGIRSCYFMRSPHNSYVASSKKSAIAAPRRAMDEK